MSKKPKAGSGLSVSQPVNTPERVFPWRVMGVVLFVQLIWLVLAAKGNLNQLNNDAIAYLRLGQYYAEGNTELALSGYWGPLLSWMIAFGIKTGLEPMSAGRAAMVISALVFQAGCIALLRGVRLNGWPAVLSASITALASIFWSVEYLSPDLLVSGLMLGAWGVLFTERWGKEAKWSAVAGALWGLAYLAKAVAFPLAIGVTVLMAALRLVVGQERRGQLKGAMVTLGVFVLVASPWVATLSAKYGHFTFSTSGSINHSIVGPEDVDRYHPVFRTFHQPDTGRVTQWEEPSRMNYQPWSPIKNLSHQTKLIRKNLETVLVHLANFDLLFIGILSAFAAVFVTRPWRERLRTDRWRWTVVPLACLCGIYLPVWVAPFDERYFYAAFPVLLITSFGTLAWLQQAMKENAWVTKVGMGLILLSFGFFPMVKASFAPQGLRHDTTLMAKAMAQAIREQSIKGPLAGSGTVLGNRTGLFTAYFLGEPWLGDRKGANAADLEASGAQILVLGLADPATEALLSNPSWRKLAVEFPRLPGMEGDIPLVVFVKSR